MGKIVVLGATSDIAQETAKRLAADGKELILTARNTDDLEKLKQDLHIRYQASIDLCAFDALNFEEHEGFVSSLTEEHGPIDGVLLMYGAMADQQEAEKDFEVTRQMIDVNYTSAVSILNLFANYFEERRRGFICAVSSVAGDRGRQSNYIYGSTKAGLSVSMEGLRNRLHKAGVQVLTIKPGMVDTKMTYGEVDEGPLLASPATVAKDIVRAITKKRHVVYTPWFWIGIMLVIKLIPETIFKRTDI